MSENSQQILSVNVVTVKHKIKTKPNKSRRIRCTHTPDTSPSPVVVTTFKTVSSTKQKFYARDGDEVWITPDDFYESQRWRSLRTVILNKYGRKCMKCGKTGYELSDDGIAVTICVDHIKPVSRYPDLVCEEDNLQVLCSICNKEKSFVDETDYRQNSS